MLIACVKVGEKYGPEYVRRLRDGIVRHLAQPHQFVCFTDKPVGGVCCEPALCGLPGYWNKIGLFRLGCPLLYFDLDVVITGDLASLLQWGGFGIIRDYWTPAYNSSVMKLAGNEGDLYRQFLFEDMRRLPGDQDYITEKLPAERTFPTKWFPSYKADKCQDAIPDGSMAVIFHGQPKPPQCGGWVADLWR